MHHTSTSTSAKCCIIWRRQPLIEMHLFKIWRSHGGDCEECRLLGYKNSARTSQETYYVFTTKLSRLMLCKIWRSHGRDYEECRLLGYKNPVRTSQETHYVSATEPSRLMLCKIWRSQKNAVFCDVTPCGCCKNRRFGGTYRLHHRGGNNQRDG
jgi:hypothetical protein